MSHHESSDLSAAIRTALAKVIDPELRRPITELGMVKSVDVEPDGGVHVGIYLTTVGLPEEDRNQRARHPGGRRRSRAPAR